MVSNSIESLRNKDEGLERKSEILGSRANLLPPKKDGDFRATYSYSQTEKALDLL